MLGSKPRLRKLDSLVGPPAAKATAKPHGAKPNPVVFTSAADATNPSNAKNKDHELRRRSKGERQSPTARTHTTASVPAATDQMKNDKMETIDLKTIENAINIDDLFVPRKELCFSKYKGVILKHTAAKKFQQVLSGKSKQPSRLSRSKDPFQNPDGKLIRRFIMEGPVQFTVGMQSQERYLFLYSDLLIVSKIRSYSVYKLKNCIRLCELWFGENIEDVCEVTLSCDSSFVLGWPITNVVANFCSSEMKNLWLTKLKQLSKESRSNEPSSTTIPVICTSWTSPRKYCKHISVFSTDTTSHCIYNILKEIGIKPEDSYQYQLWVKTANEEAPYPLIGHERPYAVKLSCLRQRQHQQHSKEKSSNNMCVFILRNVREIKNNLGGNLRILKNEKPSRRTHIVNKVFRRCSSKPDLLDLKETMSSFPSGLLFGHCLTNLCCNNTLPQPIMDILVQLVLKGPFTHGIFRKSANLKACQDLRNKLDGFQECRLETVNTLILATVFKEFLRSLPNCLLLCELYDEWLSVSCCLDLNSKIEKTKRLLQKLPKPNLILFQHFLCVLWNIAQRSGENQMTSINLAVCIGPSLLWSNKPVMQPESSKKIPPLVEFFINKSIIIFGKEILNLFGSRIQKDVSRQDSGAEESDSIHSSTSGIRQDDSSLDSLEQLLNDSEDNSKFPNHNKLSLTNLSRDSGLTMSDSQLYTPDEDEGGEGTSKNSDHSGANSFVSSQCSESVNRPVYPEVQSKAPVCERTTSAFELSKMYSKRILIRSKSAHLSSLDYANTEGGIESSNEKKTEAENFSNFYPFFKKEPHKKRLSRARQWYNPHTAWDPDDISPLSTLRKSISEESVLNDKQKTSGIINLQNQSSHRKSPSHFGNISIIESSELGHSGYVYRSKSLHQLSSNDDVSNMNPSYSNLGLNEEIIWHRTQSTPHLNDHSYDSSTVSDDDSTPHVSRSNSRGKEYVLFDDCDQLDTSKQKQAKCNSSTYDSEITFSSNSSYDYPPSYEETINRQTFLRYATPCNNRTMESLASNEPIYVNIPQKHPCKLSAYLNSGDVSYMEDELHYAVPVHIGSGDDSDPPPLPPKPKHLQKNTLKGLSSFPNNYKLKEKDYELGNHNIKPLRKTRLLSEQYSSERATFLHVSTKNEMEKTIAKETIHVLENSLPGQKSHSYSLADKFPHVCESVEKRTLKSSPCYNKIHSIFTSYNEESYV